MMWGINYMTTTSLRFIEVNKASVPMHQAMLSQPLCYFTVTATVKK